MSFFKRLFKRKKNYIPDIGDKVKVTNPDRDSEHCRNKVGSVLAVKGGSCAGDIFNVWFSHSLSHDLHEHEFEVVNSFKKRVY